ncbi:hypothetical protein [Bartonella senegalensis]|uniref:hypothetical protein n=1 Tax=Bartonella senegalensis TaxID=1468418 RepID=UPI003137CEBD
MCKHMGFTYAPDDNHYWMQGYSSEADYIYVTTNAMTHGQLRVISEERLDLIVLCLFVVQPLIQKQNLLKI